MNETWSRRRFIGAAASATIAGSAAINSAAQQDRVIRLGVAGAGNRGRNLLRHLMTINDVEVTAVCDDYAPHLEEARRITGKTDQAYERYEAMLANADLDAVAIATPPHLHHSMCVAAIDRHLAVFCETPMCHTIDEARDLARRAEKQNALFQLCLQRRSNAVYEQAEAMVRTGMLGDITAVKCQWHVNSGGRRPVPVPKTHPDYDRLDRKLNWPLYRYATNGLVAEYGSHQLDVVNRLLGVPPQRVIAVGGVDYWRDGRENPDNVFCTYEYQVPSGGNSRTVRAAFSAIQTNAHEGITELVMGAKGTLVLSPKMGLFYTENQEVHAESTVDGRSGATALVPGNPWAHRGKAVQITSGSDDTRAALVSFVNAVRTGNRDTVCGVGAGLENTATAMIANEAIESEMPAVFPQDCRLRVTKT